MMRILLLALLLIPISAVGESNQVVLQHVRTLLERKGDHVTATQFVRLIGPEEGLKLARYVIPLPSGAKGARYRDEENPGIEIEGNTIVVTGDLPPRGRAFSYQFDLEIENESATLHQEFGSRILSAQVISMWTTGDVKLTGQGFSDVEWGEASNGLQAMMIGSGLIENGVLSARLGGLAHSIIDFWKWGTLVLSVVFLCLGFASWLRRRKEPLASSKHQEASAER